MNITGIISAIGNNSSVYPLIVRDCGIEVPTKVVMTYNQNKEESKNIAYLAARERFIDEYATSAVWLGGIPVIGKLCNALIKRKGLNPNVNLKLFKEESFQGINYNIEKFKNTAPEAVKDLLKAKENKKLYEKLLAGKFIASTSIPVLFMGFILPKLVFASSAKKIEEMKKQEGNPINKTWQFTEGRKLGGQEGKLVKVAKLVGTPSPDGEGRDGVISDDRMSGSQEGFSEGRKLGGQEGKLVKVAKLVGTPSPDGEGRDGVIFANNFKFLQYKQTDKVLSPYRPIALSSDNSQPPNFQTSFTSSWISRTANFSVQDKMALTDGGYAVGRVATARNKNESIDVAFKMAGMMFLNFVAPKWIEKGLNKLTGITLDPIMLADKDFIEQIKNNDLKLPKSAAEKDLFEFIDNPANKSSIFVQYANKFGKIKMLKNGVRDPREYVDTKKLGEFRNDIEKFAKNLKESKNVKKFVRNAKISKTANILTNVGLSSFLLAYALPKCQFAFRKLVTGSDLEPGLAPAEKELG